MASRSQMNRNVADCESRNILRSCHIFNDDDEGDLPNRPCYPKREESNGAPFAR